MNTNTHNTERPRPIPTSPPVTVYDPERRYTPPRERLTRDEAAVVLQAWLAKR